MSPEFVEGISMLSCRMLCVMENLNGDCFMRVKLLDLPKMIGRVEFSVSGQETILIMFRHERAKL